jgi:hypothetical protein
LGLRSWLLAFFHLAPTLGRIHYQSKTKDPKPETVFSKD